MSNHILLVVYRIDYVIFNYNRDRKCVMLNLNHSEVFHEFYQEFIFVLL